MKLKKVLKTIKPPIGKEIYVPGKPLRTSGRRKLHRHLLKKKIENDLLLKKKAELLADLTDGQLEKVMKLVKKFKGK